ncbi:CD209 antigen-like protein D [Peromyscus californicus insignis]|uniref:CD209 antigen-like protein D n=1 Tax=Peromyscus californicus insignis TaxID=564181 RepID=UPI0022A80118|nr:CD209 antigen-like protein D [Peromyscus californicus insignis]
MSHTAEPRVRRLGSPEDEDCLISGTRYSVVSSGLRPNFGIKSLAEYLKHSCNPLVLQLLSFLFLAGLLLIILVLVSEVPSSQDQDRIYQELVQLKTEVRDGLCQPCPRDWVLFHGNCYFFSKSQRNWHNSITACQEVGAQLVIIDTDEEQTFLQQTSKAKGPTWMGLSDVHNEATWHWVDGSPLSSSFVQYWNKGEPNNVGDEDCAEFSGDGWNDIKCDTLNFWICKKALTSSCTTK